MCILISPIVWVQGQGDQEENDYPDSICGRGQGHVAEEKGKGSPSCFCSVPPGTYFMSLSPVYTPYWRFFFFLKSVCALFLSLFVTVSVLFLSLFVKVRALFLSLLITLRALFLYLLITVGALFLFSVGQLFLSWFQQVYFFFVYSFPTSLCPWL